MQAMLVAGNILQALCHHGSQSVVPGPSISPGNLLEVQALESHPRPPELETVSIFLKFLNIQFSRSVVSDSLRSHGLQHARFPYPSPNSQSLLNSCPSSRRCHPPIASSVVPFSSCLQSFPASGSFPLSQLFTSGNQSIGVSASASVLPMNIQD